MVVTQNIVRAAAWLLFTLAGTSGIFFLLGADFVGATQLLVYVGGTLVLVVFGVMLTAQGPFINMRTAPPSGPSPRLVGLLLFGVLAVSRPARRRCRGAAPGPMPSSEDRRPGSCVGAGRPALLGDHRGDAAGERHRHSDGQPLAPRTHDVVPAAV